MPTGLRPYSTIGTSRIRKGLNSRNEYALNDTRHSRHSEEDLRDIQVITDIRVQVEDDAGKKNGWTTNVTTKEWTEIESNKDTERANSSTDTLVKGLGRAN
jgi:hypothetical protein